jgi:hypothetical protein
MNEKYYLVFTPDNGSREDCNVYYSTLVIATSEQEALEKNEAAIRMERREYLEGKNMMHMWNPDFNIGEFEALEMKPIR